MDNSCYDNEIKNPIDQDRKILAVYDVPGGIQISKKIHPSNSLIK